MYKIAVFSDIHGNKEALEAILNDVEKNYDEVICLGDIIGVGPSPKECFDLMSKSKVKWILGNHDLYFLKGLDKFDIESEKLDCCKWTNNQLKEEDKKFIENNLMSYIIEKDGHTLKFCHYFIKQDKETYPFYGIGYIKRSYINDLLNMLNTEYIFYGHDHKSQQYHFEDKYLFDVGSSGCVQGDKTFYTVIEIDKKVKVYKKEIEFDRNKFNQKIKTIIYPHKEEIVKKFF